MKKNINRLLAGAFPLMALSGLVLAAYGLIVTPDELKSGHEIAAAWGIDSTNAGPALPGDGARW